MVEPIKASRIINVMKQYEMLTTRLAQDKMEFRTYNTLEPDEQKAKLYLKRIKHDYEELGKLYDMEV